MNQIDEMVNRMTNVEMNDVAKTILIKRLEDSERDLRMYESLVDSIKKEIVAINHIIEKLTEEVK
jgi:TnpA family transposase